MKKKILLSFFIFLALAYAFLPYFQWGVRGLFWLHLNVLFLCLTVIVLSVTFHPKKEKTHFFYSALCLSFFCLGLFGLWHRLSILLRGDYFSTLERYHAQTFPHLTPTEILHLGNAQNKEHFPGQSYLEFAPQKAAGKIRVGVFGGSDAFGLDVPRGRDYVSYLQQEFTRHQMNQVEVINFSVADYGNTQSYLLYQYLAKKYELDYVLMSPRDFYEERDLSFSTARNYTYGRLHSRFILQDQKLLQVNLSGENVLEQLYHYQSFFPPLSVWRYDLFLPFALGFLWPQHLGQLYSPFYHHSIHHYDQVAEESALITNKILENWQKEVPHFLLVSDAPTLERLKKHQLSPQLFYYVSQMNEEIYQRGDLYLNSNSHLSDLGNRLWAKEVFDLLTGKLSPEVEMMEFQFAQIPAPKVGAGPFSRFRQMVLEDPRGLSVGHFSTSLGCHLGEKKKGLWRERWHFFEDSSQGLLRVGDYSGKKEMFFKLPEAFRVGEKLWMKLHLISGAVEEYVLGEIKGDSQLIGYIERGQLPDLSAYSLDLSPQGLPLNFSADPQKIAAVEVGYKGHTLAKALPVEKGQKAFAFDFPSCQLLFVNQGGEEMSPGPQAANELWQVKLVGRDNSTQLIPLYHVSLKAYPSKKFSELSGGPRPLPIK